MISINGEPTPELWAAADVAGYELHTRTWWEDKISVYSAGYVVAEDLKWSNYEDLVSQLKVIKNCEIMRVFGVAK